jgi:hypothetical protein
VTPVERYLLATTTLLIRFGHHEQRDQEEQALHSDDSDSPPSDSTGTSRRKRKRKGVPHDYVERKHIDWLCWSRALVISFRTSRWKLILPRRNSTRWPRPVHPHTRDFLLRQASTRGPCYFDSFDNSSRFCIEHF